MNEVGAAREAQYNEMLIGGGRDVLNTCSFFLNENYYTKQSVSSIGFPP